MKGNSLVPERDQGPEAHGRKLSQTKGIAQGSRESTRADLRWPEGWPRSQRFMERAFLPPGHPEVAEDHREGVSPRKVPSNLRGPQGGGFSHQDTQGPQRIMGGGFQN